MKRFKQVRKFILAASLIVALGLVGCEGDDGAQGPAGPAGPTGSAGGGAGAAATANESCSVCHGPGGIRDIGVVHPQELANNLTFSLVSTNTTDLTAVTVTFDVEGPAGPVTDEAGVGFGGRFSFAKLLPGADVGDQSFWQSYINQVADGAVGPVEGTAPVLDQAVQATVEQTSAGTLVHNDLIPGQWTYTFATDFSQVGVTDIDGDGTDDVPAGTLDFAAGNLNRISGQFSARQVDPDGFVQLQLRGNPVFDFVPNAGIPSVASREVVATTTCNACHRELALHGGSRFEIEYCVTCHNPGSTDPDSGNSVDMTAMIHKIHYGENLPSVDAGGQYAIVGYRNSIHDYSTVVWPGFPIGQPLACETCHDPAAAADALNYQTVPTMNACGSCHDDVNFATGENHAGGAQPDNASCALTACHPATTTGTAPAVVQSHEIAQLTGAAAFQFNIDTVNTSFDATTRTLAVVFSVTDPTNADAAYDILADVPFVQGGSSLSVLIGWDPEELHNSGSGSVPGQPMSISALSSAVSNGDGTFTVNATIPDGIGAVRVALEGHPISAGERLPVLNVFENISTGGAVTDRRELVDINKCNACHGTLSLHGNNRTGEIGVCVMCHNPDATDIDVRPATVDDNEDGVFDNFAAAGDDGKREEAIDFKRMIHGIHAGEAGEHGISVRSNGLVVYGFRRSLHDYSHVRYPVGDSGLRNCDMCHVGSGPPPLPLAAEVLGSTIRTGDPALAGQAEIDAALEDAADDLNISPTAAVCSSCHDGGQIQSHMEINGASFGVQQENIQ
jgi:OmcA/MtrC family decaheme c-type cytochrome